MKEGTLFLGELTDTFRFQEDLPNGPHEPLPMWSPQENEPPAPPDSPSAPLLLGKTNGAPAIPSLAALQITTRTPPLPLSSQPNGLMAPNPEPRPFVPENFGPLDSPPDDMVQRSKSIQSGLSGHNQPHLISPHLSSQFRNNVPLTGELKPALARSHRLHVAFPTVGQGRRSRGVISEINTAPVRPSANASPLHRWSSTHSLRPKRVASPYSAKDFHLLHHAGFDRRFPNVPFSTSTAQLLA